MSRTRTTLGTYTDKRGFTGHITDTDTGLLYMNARYYSGTQGRFLSQDSAVNSLGGDRQMQQRLLADPQQLNTYSYARNNPVKYVDPDGKQAALAAPLMLAAPEIVVPAAILVGGYLVVSGVQNLISRGDGTWQQSFDTRRLVQVPGPMQIFDPEPPQLPKGFWKAAGYVGTGVAALAAEKYSEYTDQKSWALEFREKTKQRIAPDRKVIDELPVKTFIGPAPTKEQRQMMQLLLRQEIIKPKI